MFELAQTRLKETISTTNMIGRRIYKTVRYSDRQEFDKRIEQLITKIKDDEKLYSVDEVDEDVDQVIDLLRKGNEEDVLLEQYLAIFVLRNMEFLVEDRESFVELEKLINTKLGNLEYRTKIHQLVQYFVKEYDYIFDEIRLLARISRDQHNKDARLRDETFTLLAGLKDKMRAQRLRKIFKKNKKLSKEEQKIIRHLSVLLNHDKATNEELEKAINVLSQDLTMHWSVLKELFVSVEFVMKMGVRMFFNLQAQEGKLKTLMQHLEEQKFPEEQRQKLAKEIQRVDDWLDNAETKNMHLLYQVLHKVDRDYKKAAA